MTNLVNIIRDSIRTQDLEVLNGNPFQGWDGEITVETVLGGLYDRIKMMGEDKDIYAKRTSINEVVMTIDDEEVKITRYPALKRVEVYGTHILDRYLQTEEISFLAKFLMENLYH